VIAPTTPTGSRTTIELPIRSSNGNACRIPGTLPVVAMGRPAWMVFARVIGVPTSAETVRAISSARASSPFAIRSTARARSATGVAAQPSNAARAARTARSTSSAFPRGTRAMTSSVAAFPTSSHPVPAGAIQAPSTYSSARSDTEASRGNAATGTRVKRCRTHDTDRS
jgi:hypothetical protein